MATEGNFHINWEDFTTACLKKFRNVLGKKEFSDVTLVSSDGKRIPGHQVILASGCTFFEKLLDGEESRKPLIFFRRTDSAVLESLLSFLYEGSAEVAEDQIDQFMALAEELGVEGLAKSDQEIGYEDKCLDQNQREDVIQQQEVKISADLNDLNNRNGGFPKEKISSERKPLTLDVKAPEKNRDGMVHLEDWVVRGLGLNNHIGAVHDKKNQSRERKPCTLDVEFPERDKDGLLQCFDCERRISVKSNFRRHVRKYHLMINLKCEHCEYSTTDTAYMSYHRRTCLKKVRVNKK